MEEYCVSQKEYVISIVSMVVRIVMIDIFSSPIEIHVHIFTNRVIDW